jgi:hypothetical protein
MNKNKSCQKGDLTFFGYEKFWAVSLISIAILGIIFEVEKLVQTEDGFLESGVPKHQHFVVPPSPSG